ncbi:MAG: EAL domain-containing protein [Methylococcaceae bacterium]
MTIEKASGCNIETKVNCDFIFHNVFLDCEIGLIIVDSEYRLVNWNPWFSKHSGIDVKNNIGKSLIDIFPILQKSSVERAMISAIQNYMSSVVSHTLNRKPFPLKTIKGNVLEQQIIVKPVFLESQQSICLIQITDVSAAVSREKQLKEHAIKTRVISEKLAQQNERAQVTLNSIADAVITTDENGNILSMNPVAEMLTGVYLKNVQYTKVDQVFKLIHEQTNEPIVCPVTQCLDLKDTIANDFDHVLVGVAGAHFAITDSVAPIVDAKKQLLGTVLVFRDVTQSRALSAELNWQALHDPLTGLANRREFESRMKLLQQKAKFDRFEHHLLYLDLDQFKVVNDTCGHDAGDELLKQVTDALAKKLRKSDLLARLGGDEFGILLESCNAENALSVANTLRQAVEDFRFAWHTQSFKIGVSIGISEITGEEVNAAEILSAADSACYVAKESGRNRVHIHQLNSSASSEHQKEMQWISRLQAALDNDCFELYLQRIQDVRSTETASEHYEVLLRMIGENGEIIPPGAFLPAAERFNLVGSIDRWVVENVFKKLEQLKKDNKKTDNLFLSINLSGASMTNDDLFKRISLLLDGSDFPAKHFCFEVTETAAISNLKQATDFLLKLRSRGCKIALDDFGSGLSSFAYLKSLPIDYIKIDGYFVKDIAIDHIDRAFVEAINKIGQVMGLATIAEFVEDDTILDILKEIKVDYAQGYGVHKPCAFDQVFR